MSVLDAATGKELASLTEGAPAGERASVAHLVGGRLFHVSKGDLFALDVATGRRLWNVACLEVRYFVADEKRVVAMLGKEMTTRGAMSPMMDAIVAFDAATGKLLWRFEGLKGNRAYRIVLAGEQVVVPYFPTDIKGGGGASSTAAMAVLNATDGKLAWQDDTQRRNDGHQFPTAVLNGPEVHYLVCEDGTLICFDAEKGASNPGAGFTVAKKGDRDVLQRVSRR